MFHGYGPDEIQELADAKRLLERCKADPEFRKMIRLTPSERLRLLSDLGVSIDCVAWDLFWEHLEDGRGFRLGESDLPAYAPLKLWGEWQRQFHRHLGRLSEEWAPAGNTRVAAWRSRQIRRFASEVVPRAVAVFPVLAYELSKGCSVGCWFCGLSPGRLQGVAPYTIEGAQLWREILGIGLDLFGPGSRTALCYHGTEPLDNPDYLDFLRDFNDVCGIYPQTTTAVPLKNVQLTRELLRLRESCPVIPDRFSVLSLSSLKGIHRTFSPYELRYVGLALHNRGALTYQTNAGRARERPQKLEEANLVARRYDPNDNPLDPNTIDCVCGYLVNLVDRSIKLISPCRATDRWPNGYRVHAAGIFRDAAEYRAFLERTIEEHMPEKLAWQAKVSFRQDLRYERLADGFALTSRVYRHSLRGKPWYGALGGPIARGGSSAGEIITQVASEGVPLPEVMSTIQQLFDRGLFEEELGDEAPRPPDE